MKKEIIPAILVKNKRNFRKFLKLSSTLSNIVQIDIMDGMFVDNETPKDLNLGQWIAEYLIKEGAVPNIELHLMVLDPWEIIQAWEDFDFVKRIVWHVEIPINHRELIYQVHRLGFEVGLAINPKTSLLKIIPFLKDCEDKTIKQYALDELLFLGVDPGFSGQDFNEKVLENIEFVKKYFPDVLLALDGGVKLTNINMIAKKGIVRFNVGSGIFKSKNLEETFNQFKINVK